MQSTIEQLDDGMNRNRYHIGILKHVQAIFAHLGHSALQYYVPRGLWTHFKYVYALYVLYIKTNINTSLTDFKVNR